MTERREDVSPLAREESRALGRLLELLHRFRMVVALRRGEAERDPRSERSGPVAGSGGLREQVS